MSGIRVALLSLAVFISASAVTASFPADAQQAVIAGGFVANGKALAVMWCSSCHLVGPAGDNARASSDVPPFTAIAKMLPTDADVLAAFIANPHPPMPNLGLSRQDIRDLMAYIASLR